jgi:deferrochelatase/peroxidase EfeB
VTVGFTCSGMRALGVAESSLATFPEEFRQGMAARADILGITGANHPDHWVGDLAKPNLHAIAILFARDVAERERCRREHEGFLAQCEGVEALSSLDLEAIPPFDYAHEHFGYRDRLSQPVIDGTEVEPTPGSGPPIKAGEFFLGYPDEEGPSPGMPQPEVLSRNGSYVAYLRMQEHVSAFRDFLRQHGETPEQEEFIAAKLMGRWRSGAPLVLAPNGDNPELGADPLRTNDFNYAEADAHGYACPLGAHIRRMNPRDTAVNMNRRKMIRRGGTYGPPLPEGAPEDGIERGIAAFIGCVSLVRQFEFAMNVWANDPNFHELGNERDPIFGTQDGTFDITIPKRPIRKKIKGLPAFTTIRGGAYFFLPGIKALRYLASLGDGH